ncbi:MAG: RHS repeat-associated core domain-containing protein [Burkholderiales bacterium]
MHKQCVFVLAAVRLAMEAAAHSAVIKLVGTSRRLLAPSCAVATPVSVPSRLDPERPEAYRPAERMAKGRSMSRLRPAKLTGRRALGWIEAAALLAMAIVLWGLATGSAAKAEPARPGNSQARLLSAGDSVFGLKGYMVGSGSNGGCDWGGQIPLSMSVTFKTSDEFSGSWSAGGNVDTCDFSQPVLLDGKVSGKVSKNGRITSFEMTVNQYGKCVFREPDAGSMQGSGITLFARVDASCVNSELSGNIDVVACYPDSACAVPSTLGPAGSSTNPGGSAAEPVNTATGNFYSSYTDLHVHGRGLDFVFNRYYNSLGSAVGPLGANWTHSYVGSLAADPVNGTVTIQEPSGGLLTFDLSGSSYVSRNTGSFDTLTRNANGSFTLTRINRTKITFSAEGLLQSVTDRNGNTQSLAYSSAGDLTSLTDTAGRVFTFSYDANHRIAALADPTGRIVRYGYDANGDLISVTDPLGGVTSYTYDAAHRMVKLVDARGVTFLQNAYDANGRVATQTNALGKITRFSYASGSTSITDANGNVTRHVYDQALRLTQAIDGAGSAVSYTYNANNLKSAVSDPNGRTTNFVYNAQGHVITLRDAAGNLVISGYDTAGNPTSVISRSGRTTTSTYDANGNLLTITDPSGGVARSTYDGSGQILTSTDPAGNKAQYQYDSAGNRTRIADGAGRVTTMAYDPLGRMTSVTDGLGHATRIEYDALDRVVSRKDGAGNQTQYSYDAVGHLTKVTDANGNATSFTYDGAGNRVAMTDALGQQTRYGYDGNDNLISVVNPRGKTTAFSYDAANRLTRIADSLGRTRSLAYDAAGNLTTLTDGNGKVTRFAYNSLDRLTGITYFDGSVVSFAYDADENRTSVTDWNGTTTYTYDVLNRLSAVRRFDGKVIRYGYDAAGRKTSLTYPDGSIVHSQYDGGSRLTGVTDWNGRKTAYTYDDAGNLIGIALPNGVMVSYAYDGADRVTRVSVVNADGSKGPSLAHVLDAAGNRLQTTGDAGIFRYAYDPLNRLTSWSSPSGATTRYTYDASGNRTSLVNAAGTTAYTYDDADQMMTAGPASFTYDGNGSRLTRTAAGKTTSYAWDPANRLASVSGAGTSVQYGYDGDGNRLTQSGVAYVNDAGRPTVPLHEDGPDGSIDYVRGVSLIAGIGTKGTYYRTDDGTPNTAHVFDASGLLKAAYVYDPWGNLLNPADPLGSRQKNKYADQAFDAASGLYYMRARYYDPLTGAFLSRDPLNLAGVDLGDGSPYTYARNNPLTFYDPTGLVAEKGSQQDCTGARQPNDYSWVDAAQDLLQKILGALRHARPSWFDPFVQLAQDPFVAGGVYKCNGAADKAACVREYIANQGENSQLKELEREMCKQFGNCPPPAPVAAPAKLSGQRRGAGSTCPDGAWACKAD